MTAPISFILKKTSLNDFQHEISLHDLREHMAFEGGILEEVMFVLEENNSKRALYFAT